jgi:hypothetical protein
LNQSLAGVVWLQNIDSRDLVWKIFEWNILRRVGRYSARIATDKAKWLRVRSLLYRTY